MAIRLLQAFSRSNSAELFIAKLQVSQGRCALTFRLDTPRVKKNIYKKTCAAAI